MSADQVYDVCRKPTDGLVVESNAQRPANDHEAQRLNHHFQHANKLFKVRAWDRSYHLNEAEGPVHTVTHTVLFLSIKC